MTDYRRETEGRYGQERFNRLMDLYLTLRRQRHPGSSTRTARGSLEQVGRDLDEFREHKLYEIRLKEYAFTPGRTIC